LTPQVFQLHNQVLEGFSLGQGDADITLPAEGTQTDTRISQDDHTVLSPTPTQANAGCKDYLPLMHKYFKLLNRSPEGLWSFCHSLSHGSIYLNKGGKKKVSIFLLTFLVLSHSGHYTALLQLHSRSSESCLYWKCSRCCTKPQNYHCLLGGVYKLNWCQEQWLSPWTVSQWVVLPPRGKCSCLALASQISVV